MEKNSLFFVVMILFFCVLFWVSLKICCFIDDFFISFFLMYKRLRIWSKNVKVILKLWYLRLEVLVLGLGLSGNINKENVFIILIKKFKNIVGYLVGKLSVCLG